MSKSNWQDRESKKRRKGSCKKETEGKMIRECLEKSIEASPWSKKI